LVGINENASFRILRTIAELAYTPWKQPGKSYFEGIQTKSAAIKKNQRNANAFYERRLD